MSTARKLTARPQPQLHYTTNPPAPLLWGDIVTGSLSPPAHITTIIYDGSRGPTEEARASSNINIIEAGRLVSVFLRVYMIYVYHGGFSSSYVVSKDEIIKNMQMNGPYLFE